MMPSEYCAECGVKLTPEEQLMFLDVCHGCECVMWIGFDEGCDERNFVGCDFSLEQNRHDGTGLLGSIKES